MVLYEVICYLQHVSLLLQLQLYGSCKQIGQIIVLHPIHVLSALLQPQCLQSLIERISSTMNTIFMAFGLDSPTTGSCNGGISRDCVCPDDQFNY
jgi:hypothetical protein